MSLVLKANELNTLIYKYLLEAGLSHSAYTLFNEAALAQPLQEFRFDVKAGHLLSLLERALIYSKIEAHVTFNEYLECNEPFFLLKPHTCKVVERARKERTEALQEIEEQLNLGIKRTNSAYNTAIANRDFEEIVYEAKGKKYFEKFAKIRLPANDPDADHASGKFILRGTEVYTLLYNSDDCEMDLLRYDTINEEISIEKIFPSVKMGELARSVDEAISNQQIIQLFDGNHVTLFDLRQDQAAPVEFALANPTQLTAIQHNPHIPQLVCFKNDEIFNVVNVNSLKVIRKGQGLFYWHAFDQYLLITDGNIRLYSVMQEQPLQTFDSDIKWQDILFNASRNLFAAISYIARTMHVFTFESSKPLFIFGFEDKILRQALFVTSNSVDYLCWLTNENIKLFDLSLNAYSKVIDVQEYDSQVQQICALRKADKDQVYLLGLGSQNLLVYDISNSKIERVEIEGRVSQLKQLGPSRVAMVTDTNIYFLVGQYIDPLFK